MQDLTEVIEKNQEIGSCEIQNVQIIEKNSINNI